VISDLLVREGQEVGAGDHAGSVADEQAGYELVSLLPGSYAPLIHRGMPLTLRLAGYPDVREQLTVDSVASEVIGPREAASLLGNGDGTLPPGGVHVNSTLHDSKFAVGRRRFTYRDGMTGQVELVVRSEPMLVSLVPALKPLLTR
jgi:membrane fusion protein (multidrug efflux system)